MRTKTKSIPEVVLGRTYRDKISGLIGVATAKHEDLNGMIQYTISPKAKEDNTQLGDAYMMDPAQLEDIETKEQVKPSRTGGPTTAVKR